MGGENVHEPNVQILIKGNSTHVALKKEQSTFKESTSFVFLYSQLSVMLNITSVGTLVFNLAP